MAKVELKQPIVQEIAENIEGAQSVVVVDYRGLTVAQDTQLRKELREAGVTYKVYKNTLMNLAFKGTDCESLTPVLEGPSAIAISKTDATAPARILAKFAKNAEALEIKAGIVEGAFYATWKEVLLWNESNFRNSFQRRTSFQVAGKPSVSYRKFCPCYQSDRGKRRRSRRSSRSIITAA